MKTAAVALNIASTRSRRGREVTQVQTIHRSTFRALVSRFGYRARATSPPILAERHRRTPKTASRNEDAARCAVFTVTGDAPRRPGFKGITSYCDFHHSFTCRAGGH